MSSILIRDARRDDIARFVELITLGAFGDSFENPDNHDLYQAAFDEIERSLSSLLVAEMDRVVVGGLQLIVFRLLQDNGGLCAELESVHVHPDLRGHGIGGALVEAAVERARELGCHQVQLTSNSKRDNAHRFYESHGFTQSHKGFKRFL